MLNKVLRYLKTYYPIGLDIGQANIRMVQLESSGDRPSVYAAYEKRIPFEIRSDADLRLEFIKETIQSVVKKGIFKGNEVVAGIPNDVTIIKSTRIGTDQKDLSASIRDIASKRFSLNPDKYEVDYIVAGQVAGDIQMRDEFVIFAVSKEYINTYIKFIEQCGLSLVGLDPLPCACYRSLEPSVWANSDEECANVMVDIGHRFTTIIIGKGQEIAFVKQVDLAGERFNREVAAKLGIEVQQASLLRKKVSDPSYQSDISNETKQLIKDALNHVVNELVREITLCFRYYTVTFRGRRPEKLFVSGGCAYEENLLEHLSDRLGMRVEYVDPFNTFMSGRSSVIRQKNRCEWTCSLGLAVKKMLSEVNREDAYARN